MVLVAGAALAAPALVLEVRSATRELVLPMRERSFIYSYRQSIYDVAVREHLRVDGGAFRIERASSSDLRALEYFRWPGEAREVSGTLEWDAPPNSVGSLELAVVDRGEQRLDTGVRSLDLRDAFGAVSITALPAWRPLALWLWHAVTPGLGEDPWP